jgi:predicted flap endonuclease-1-like 5' DNA nuclease
MKTLPPLEKRARALQELQAIPGIGPSLAQDLYGLGITRVAQLKGKNPDRLYDHLEKQAGVHMDRCVLYAFRCAVYYAENPQPDQQLLKWWNWKDGALRSK